MSAKQHNNPSRREFLAAATATVGTLLLPSTLQALSTDEVSREALANDPGRPQFHLLPARNWMNDPNGPIYWKGRYHMFFQYNPNAATWGDMNWNHAVSPDMIHWTHLPIALSPTPSSYDSFGVFSGSAIAVGDRVYAVYTGTQHSSDDKATIRDGANNIQESQCLAWSDDKDLIHWTKSSANPVIPAPPPGMKITGFRDPSVWKQAEWFYMTVGSGIAKVGGNVLLYRSRDLKSWEYLHALTSGKWNGIPTANPCDDGEMWECPEFFPLDGGHVLIYSTLGKVYWQSGTFDPVALTFTPKKTGLLDLDAFYAPKTQLDAQGRRILWGWIPERRSEDAMRKAGWSGMMSLPRVLALDQDGILRMKFLPRLTSLRIRRLGDLNGIVNFDEPNGEFLCKPITDCRISFLIDQAEVVRAKYFAKNHIFQIGKAEVALQPEDAPSIHAYFDGSVIELILGERISMTLRFYRKELSQGRFTVETDGHAGVLNAWPIKPISHNRLTTPAVV